MARLSFSIMICGIAFTAVLMPEFLSAGPVGHHEEKNVMEAAAEETTNSVSPLKRLSRNRRNIAYYRSQPDYWGWYRYYMDTNNQEGVEGMDRMYVAYLQNKHRVEEGRNYNHYLTHLSEIYKTCANSDDPDCIAELTSKPKAKLVMPFPIKQAAVTVCNPYLDPYCMYAARPKVAEEESSAPAKIPAPILSPLLPLALKTHPGQYYYGPALAPFLSAEQRDELLRICNPSDTECLQYHLRAAYGYTPTFGALPSYANLGCDPTKDPYCQPKLVARAPSGLYHLYPANVAAPKEQSPFNLACDPRYDPYCLMGGTAALLRPPPILPQFQTRHQLGIRGKTKEGYDCYVYYDKDCTPVENQDLRSASVPECHPYDPTCGKFAAQKPAGIEAAKMAKDGIVEPHPDCDPEIDFNCRLRRAETTGEEQKDDAGQQKQDQVAAEDSVPRFEDFLRGYMGGYKK
ncbi:actinodin2 [Misgurnus anguillicaudatus]|uniref:actinodin2 n=1 Tax=Misgurnus anguillicaudatus TaxID=75329 RepID=UPI002434EDCD|nr:actinodin2 [Misgurnus anguillicaudatus]XP_055057896.1 actinodin2 [Misgurnus anguillicaudatus]